MKLISEIQITPVKPQNGLMAFCSFVLFEALYCGSVAIFSRPNGAYRLVYPTKKVADRDMHMFHPIEKRFADQIQQAVIKQLENVMTYDRHSSDAYTGKWIFNLLA